MIITWTEISLKEVIRQEAHGLTARYVFFPWNIFFRTFLLKEGRIRSIRRVKYYQKLPDFPRSRPLSTYHQRGSQNKSRANLKVLFALFQDNTCTFPYRGSCAWKNNIVGILGGGNKGGSRPSSQNADEIVSLTAPLYVHPRTHQTTTPPPPSPTHLIPQFLDQKQFTKILNDAPSETRGMRQLSQWAGVEWITWSGKNMGSCEQSVPSIPSITFRLLLLGILKLSDHMSQNHTFSYAHNSKWS